ncbi:hypothetical protein CYLTODRAFT_418559 [Cylindrobasidium torrendii FP15055 ss-10]|uniref:Lytic polysaccharide monooxygenase n=1 Tax=Cylindrobasidium torrendii FP15055 ss-10 TaxID=1314674 RepID=A0A0D7BMR0_9AGAR|nr:hypothetical protein CYLTODRAFT_418559 [Cylindrobasidium torrendii FP15055 ss-10]
MLVFSVAVLTLPVAIHAHFAAFALGMYCRNGTDSGIDNQNNNAPVQPLWMLKKEDWWFHHSNKCDEFPPNEGDFLELPANGEFTVELAPNRAGTTLSYDGRYTARFGDGNDHDEFDKLAKQGELTTCITEINIHTPNETMAAGTVFAISYNSNLSDVTAENLVVFSALYHTPWYRLAKYQVPNLPACPEDGCTCAWGWVPNGCGEPNMYMQGFKCKVVGETGNRALAQAKPPVWCEGEPDKCQTGAKQMVYWHQLDGNNVEVDGFDSAGMNKSPGYNRKMGFDNGRQTDIFDDSATVTTTSIAPTSTSFAPENPNKDPVSTVDGDDEDSSTLPTVPLWYYIPVVFNLSFVLQNL